ncbi:MAG: hypothetical protein QXP36_14440 [Conexivisphaerales archaeon]
MKNEKKNENENGLTFLEDEEYREDLELMKYQVVNIVLRNLSTKVLIEGQNGTIYNGMTGEGQLELYSFALPGSIIKVKRNNTIIKIKVYKELDFIIDDSEGFIHISTEVN